MMQDLASTNTLQQRAIGENIAQTASKLFDLDPDLDVPNSKEEELYNAYCKLQRLFEGKSTLKITAEVQEKVHTLYEEINCGLLYGILTDPVSAPKYLNFLRITVKDHFKLISDKLLGLVSSHSFRKFGKIPCKQTIWLLEALCENSIIPFQKTFTYLIRQVKAYDLSHNSINIATGIVKILYKHRENLPTLSLEVFQMSVYSFLRMIPEHITTPQLYKSEVDYVIYALNSNFSKCIPIGRDLIRALQEVSAIPEFSAFWRKLLFAPQSLTISDILAIPTSKWILSSRLTPEMEAKLGWLLLSVPKSVNTSFLSRYVTKFLKSSSQEYIYIDFIRFICVVIHPTNEIIKSNIIQRWDAILYLLKTIENEKVAQQVKLALFYDFFFWNSNADNIMNIEPSILLIVKCIKSNSESSLHIAASLVEFLHLTTEYYYQDISKNIYLSINLAMRELISRGVLRSIKQIYSSKFNKKVKSQFETLFRLFINNDGHLPSVSTIIDYFNNIQPQLRVVNVPSSIQHRVSETQISEPNTQSISTTSPVDILTIRKAAQSALNEISQRDLSFSRKTLINAIQNLKLHENSPVELTKTVISIFNIYSSISKLSNFELDVEFGNVLCSIKHKLPTPEELFNKESKWNISPLLCLLEASNERLTALESPEEFEWPLLLSVFLNPERKITSVILFLWTVRHCCLTACYEAPLLFPKVLEKADIQFNTYMYECMEIIQHENIDLFFSVLDILFPLFPNEATGNVDLISLIVQVIDPKNLLTITNKLESDNWRMFGYKNLSGVIRYLYKASSEFPEPTQTILWRMLLSEFSERSEEVSDIGLRLLETGSTLSKSAEATYAFQKLLLTINPDERHIRSILISKNVDSVFILKKWIKKFNFSEELINIINKVLKSFESDPYKDIIDPNIIPIINEILRSSSKKV